MGKYTFILSDETLNSQGFVVLTGGIDLERFRKNPVMYYMHKTDRGVIGRWENIRIEGDKLLGDAVFNDNDPLGKQVREQIDSGFLRSASICISDVEIQTIKGVNTAVKCVLMEVSVVDIPANQNAVRLRDNAGKIVYRLADLQGGAQDMRPQIIGLLNLPATATDEEIVEAVRRLTAPEDVTLGNIGSALKIGLIHKSEAALLQSLAHTDPGRASAYIQSKKNEQKEEIDKEIRNACRDGKFIYQDREVFEGIAAELGLKALRTLLSVIPERVTLSDLVNQGGISTDRWGLEEYRKYAPQRLKDDPDLYRKLLRKSNRDKEDERSLEWYRRNNPEYLAEHPDVYRKLLEKNRK